MKSVIFYLFLCLFIKNGFAQSSFIDANRTGFSNTPHLLAKNKFQIENVFSKATVRYSAFGKEFKYRTPYLKLKYGLNKFIELNTSLRIRKHEGFFSNNISNQFQIPLIILGTKFALFKQNKLIPKTALLLEITRVDYDKGVTGFDSI